MLRRHLMISAAIILAATLAAIAVRLFHVKLYDAMQVALYGIAGLLVVGFVWWKWRKN